MKISVHTWNEVDFQELAAVMHAARAHNKRSTIQSLVQEFLHWRYDEPPVVICARSHDKLVGWLMLHITSPTMVEVNPGPFGGHPVVRGSSEVRALLIKEAITYATARGFEKIDLTISMEEPSEQYKAYTSWYTAHGFEPFYFCMKCILSEQEYAGFKVPAGIEIKQTVQISEDDLYHCYYDAFNAGEAEFFFDQTEDEKWEFFRELSPSEALIEECSLVFIKDQQVVGFTYVLEYGGEENNHLSLICIHPDFQGQGLGKTLLLITMKKAARKYRTMTLYTEADTSALTLYRACGFKEGGGSITYIYRVRK